MKPEEFYDNTPRENVEWIEAYKQKDSDDFDRLGVLLAGFTSVIAGSSGNYKRGRQPTRADLFQTQAELKKKQPSLDEVREQQIRARSIADRMPTPRKARKHL